MTSNTNLTEIYSNFSQEKIADYLKKTPYNLVFDSGTIQITNSDGKVIAPTALLPLRAVEEVLSDGSTQVYIEVSAYHKGTLLPTVKLYGVLKKFDLFYLTWGNHRFPYLDKNAKSAVLCIFSELAGFLEGETVYSFPCGWIDNDALLIKNILIGKSGIIYVENISLTKGLALYNEKNEKELFEAINSIYLHVLKKPVYSLTLFFFLIMGIFYRCLRELDGLVPSFILYIQGGSGTGKTSSTMPLLNPFELPTASFEDSKSATARLFQETGSACFVIDDLKFMNRDSEDLINLILRMAGDNTTQRRRVSGNKVSKSEISCLCAITGEVKLNLQPSSLARMLVIEYDRDTVDFTVLNEFRMNKDKIITALLALVQKIISDDIFVETLVSGICEKRHAFTKTNKYTNMHGRYVDMIAWFTAMHEMIAPYFSAVGIPLYEKYPQEIEELIVSMWTANKSDPTTVFGKLLFEMINLNMLTLVPESEFANGKPCDIVDYGDILFVASGTVFTKLKHHADEIGLYINFSEKQLRNELLNTGILQQHNGKNTLELRKGSGRCSGFYIRKNKLRKILGENLEEEL